MSERIIKLDDVRERVRSSENLSDLTDASEDVEYLTDKAMRDLDIALEIANDSLFAVRALAHQKFVTPTER